MPALPPQEPASHVDAGDGAHKTVVDARGGQPTGKFIWVLVGGLILVVIALFGVWALRAGDLAKATNGNEKSAEVSNFQAPEPSPKQAPPDMPSTTGQTTPEATSNTAGR